MPDQNEAAAEKLRKLGKHLRASKLVPSADPARRKQLLEDIRTEWPKPQKSVAKTTPQPLKQPRKGPDRSH